MRRLWWKVTCGGRTNMGHWGSQRWAIEATIPAQNWRNKAGKRYKAREEGTLLGATVMDGHACFQGRKYSFYTDGNVEETPSCLLLSSHMLLEPASNPLNLTRCQKSLESRWCSSKCPAFWGCREGQAGQDMSERVTWPAHRCPTSVRHEANE